MYTAKNYFCFAQRVDDKYSTSKMWLKDVSCMHLRAWCQNIYRQSKE